MKCLQRNKTHFWYCTFLGNVLAQDEQGVKTGEIIPTYSSVISCCASISSEKGSSQLETFGNFEDYDKVIIIDNPKCEIDENTILFIGIEPIFVNKIPQYNYIVKRVSRSLNNSAYAIKKVK